MTLGRGKHPTRHYFFFFLEDFFDPFLDLAFLPPFLEDFLTFFLSDFFPLLFFFSLALDLAFGGDLAAFRFLLAVFLRAGSFDFLAAEATFLAAAITRFARTRPKPGTAAKASAALDAIDSAEPNPCVFRVFAVEGPIPEISVTGVLIYYKGR